MKQLLIVLLLGLLWFSTNAQHSISGIVTDEKNKKPLVGLNVYIPELGMGTVTDTNGYYLLPNLPERQHILLFSFMGFKTINQIIFNTGEDIVLNIEMEELVLEGEEVVISGNFTTTQHDNTVSISTIKKRDLQLSGSPSMIETLAETPGIDLISKGPGIGSPVIRGLSLSNILFLNNGIPMENYQFSENHPYMVDEYGLERIEIIKGPSSLIYGSGAVGGIINLINENVATNGSIEGDWNLKYFGNSSGISSNLGIKGNQNGFVWGVRGGVISNKDYRQGNGEIARNTRFNRQSAKLNIGLIRKIGSFQINYQYNHDQLGLAVPEAFDIADDNQRENEVWYQDLFNHFVSSKNKIFLGKLRLDADLSYQRNNRQLKGSELTPEFDLVDMTLQTVNYQLKSTYTFTESASAVLGIQGKAQNNQNADAPNHVLPDANLNDFSVFGLGQYRFGSQWIMEAGFRYSYLDIHVPLQEAAGHSHGEEEEEEEEVEMIEYDNQFNNLSASLGTTFNFTDEMLIRLNLASAFRSPNLAELTQHGMHGVRFEEGNPDLQTQQNLEVDLGYHLHTRHLTFDFSVFYNNIFNYIHLAPSQDSTEDGHQIYRYTQADAHLYGGEAAIHIHPHPVHWLHLKSTYSYVHGETKEGENLPFIPAQKLKIEVQAMKNRMGFLRASFFKVGLNFAFAQNYPALEETQTPAYTLLNLSAGFSVKVQNQLFNFAIIANNILDATYYDHLSTLKPIGVYDIGRNISFSVKIPFGMKKAD